MTSIFDKIGLWQEWLVPVNESVSALEDNLSAVN